MKKYIFVLSYLLLVVLSFSSALTVAAEDQMRWAAYDETEDLAQLALHENNSMHFKLLN